MKIAAAFIFFCLLAFSSQEVLGKPLCPLPIPRCKEPLLLVCACLPQKDGFTKCDWTCIKP